MRNSVPSLRYSSACKVLHLWRILLIPILIESTDTMMKLSGDVMSNSFCLVIFISQFV